jgi:hypothetical protein
MHDLWQTFFTRSRSGSAKLVRKLFEISFPLYNDVTCHVIVLPHRRVDDGAHGWFRLEGAEVRLEDLEIGRRWVDLHLLSGVGCGSFLWWSVGDSVVGVDVDVGVVVVGHDVATEVVADDEGFGE